MWPGGVFLAAVLLSIAAFVFAPGAPFVAVPIALLVVAVGWLLNTSRNRRGVRGMRDLRGQAQTADQDSEDIEFTDRDKQSLYTQ
jgi:hypothetical protein